MRNQIEPEEYINFEEIEEKPSQQEIVKSG